jgi:hypothetical protein
MQPLSNCKELLTCCLPPRGAPQSWAALQKLRHGDSFTGYHPVINQNIGGGYLAGKNHRTIAGAFASKSCDYRRVYPN